jgi:hypothetical protein
MTSPNFTSQKTDPDSQPHLKLIFAPQTNLRIVRSNFYNGNHANGIDRILNPLDYTILRSSLFRYLLELNAIVCCPSSLVSLTEEKD